MAFPRLTPLTPADPRTLGGYRLAGRLGAGGMGVVYAGHDPAGRPVAIKLVHAVLAGDDEFRRRFRREVARARQVPPSCTAEVLDADVDHDPPYLVVEYIDGPSLDETVRRHGPLGPAALRELAAGTARALVAIHGARVVHRDLKPGNVLLGPDGPRVIDFGIAQDGGPGSVLTNPDHVAGTIAYMAPERFDTAPVTAAADIFSWGLVIGYAATGRNPFEAGTPSGTAGRILTQRPDLTGLPEPLRRVVAAALAKDPAMRPSAQGLLDLLGPAAAPPPRSALRKRLAVVAAVVLLGGAGTAAGLHASHPAAPPPVFSSGRAASPPSPRVSSRPPVAVSPPVPAEPGGGRSVISDPLSRSGQWIYTNLAAEHATCDITDTLRATRVDRGVLLCIGPEMHLKGAHSIAVDTVLERAGSCAAIWFFWTGGHGGYVARFCRDSVTLAADRYPDRHVLGELPLPHPVAVGRPAHVEIFARTATAEIFLDHQYVGTFPLPAGDPKDGGDVLGLSVESVTDKPPFTVAYANVDIRTYTP